MNPDDIRDKIAKLLSTADSLGDSPAAETYRDRAFDLAARYGVEASTKLPGQHVDEMLDKHYTFSGSYTDMQGNLLGSISAGLHCYPVSRKKRNSTVISEAWVFGRRRHVERVDMLFTILNPMMISAAKKRPAADLFSDVSETTRKRSFMRGFAASVYRRLEEAEKAHEADHSVAGHSGAMVLLGDAEQAEAAANEKFTVGKRRKNPARIDRAALAAGIAAGDQADVGQTRMHGRKALTA